MNDKKQLRTAAVMIAYFWVLMFITALSVVSFDTATGVVVFIQGALISLVAYLAGVQDQRDATKRAAEKKTDEGA